MASDPAPSPRVEPKQDIPLGKVADTGRALSKSMLERTLISFDVGVPGAVLRIALGFLLMPALQRLRLDPRPWTVVAALLVMLFAVKVFAAVGRCVVQATNVVRQHWEWRRNLARYHDSYQWRKLVWVGIGLLIGAVLGSPGTTIQWVLGAVCCMAGGAAEVLWRRQQLGVTPPHQA